MTTKTSINDLFNIPRRMEPLGGQTYAYIRLEEAVYLFEDALAERDTIAAELAEVKAERDQLYLQIKNQEAQIKGHHKYTGEDYKFRLDKVTAERDALKARLDGGIRVHFWYDDNGNGCFGLADKAATATLILDEGTVP